IYPAGDRWSDGISSGPEKVGQAAEQSIGGRSWLNPGGGLRGRIGTGREWLKRADGRESDRAKCSVRRGVCALDADTPIIGLRARIACEPLGVCRCFHGLSAGTDVVRGVADGFW